MSDREDLRLSLQRAKFAFLDAVNQLQAYDTANAVGMVEAAVLPVVAQAKAGAFPPSGGIPARALAFGAQRIGLLVGPY